MTKKKITYQSSGVDYTSLDSLKKEAQKSAEETGKNLKHHEFEEETDSRGESAYVFKKNNLLLATVIEGLGTKNLVADEIGTPDKTYYDIIGHDTVATIINDLVSVGATPLTIHAYWAVGDSKFLTNKKRIHDLIRGWKDACNISQVSWGGGETPTLKDIVNPNTIELGGSSVGVIENQSHFLHDKKLMEGDQIIFIKSNGVNANGLTLIRNLASELRNGYETKISDNLSFRDAVMTKSNIYAKLISDILNTGIELHYISNITGHGLRKVMRAKPDFTYQIDAIFEPSLLFEFIKEQAALTDEEMYETYNMGQDYALFLQERDIERTLKIITKHGFTGMKAGVVKKGKKQVVIKPLNITYSKDTLDLR